MADGKIPAWAQKFLSSHDRERIDQAIRGVERDSEGEVVVVIARSSTPLNGVVISSVLLMMALFAVLESHFLLASAGWFYFLGLVIAMVLGLAVSRVPIVQRFLLPDADEMKAVFDRAELEFYREGVFRTQKRTGILIFISLLEHRALILADEGISKELPAETWKGIVDGLVKEVGQGQLAIGLTRSIEECGKLLKIYFPKQGPAVEELRNELVFKE